MFAYVSATLVPAAGVDQTNVYVVTPSIVDQQDLIPGDGNNGRSTAFATKVAGSGSTYSNSYNYWRLQPVSGQTMTVTRYATAAATAMAADDEQREVLVDPLELARRMQQGQ